MSTKSIEKSFVQLEEAVDGFCEAVQQKHGSHNQSTHGRGGGGGGGGYAQARTAVKKEASGVAKAAGLKKLSGAFADEDMTMWTGPAGKGKAVVSALKKKGYTNTPNGTTTPISGGPGRHFQKSINTAAGKMKVHASVNDTSDFGTEMVFYGKGAVQA